jgi:hypothetical protein
MTRVPAAGSSGRLATALLVAVASACRGTSDPPSEPPAAAAPKAASASFGPYENRDTIGAIVPAVPLRVLDAAGRPMAGVTVRWTTTDLGAEVTPSTGVTDFNGVAVARWQFGTRTGVQSLTAAVPGLPPVIASATVVTGMATTITATLPRVMVGAVGETSVPLSLAAFDRGGNGFPGTLSMPSAPIGAEVARLASDAPSGATVALATGWGTGAIGVRVAGTSAQTTITVDVPRYARVWTHNARTCAADDGGALACWGDNLFGVFGDGSTASRRSPGLVLPGASVAQVGIGRHTICVLDNSGQAHCAGLNDWGELGDGSVPASRPTFAPIAGGLRFMELSAGGSSSCGITAAGAAHCWGMDALGQLGRDTVFGACHANGSACTRVPVAVDGGLTFARLWVGQDTHACGITRSGDAYCWGKNTFGQLGTDRPSVPCGAPAAGFVCVREPAPVAGGRRFTRLAPGNNATCGLTTAGEAYCWGWRSVSDQRSGPVPAAPGLTFVDLQAGGWSTCGLTAAGAVHCWGGPIGLAPQRLATPHAFTAMAVGAASDGSDRVRVCGIVRDGGAACQPFTIP